MRMDRQPDIGCIASGLDGQRNLADQVTRVRTNDATAQEAVRLGIEQQLGETLFPSQRERTPIRHPRECTLLVRDVLGFGFCLRQADPGDFRIRVSN